MSKGKNLFMLGKFIDKEDKKKNEQQKKSTQNNLTEKIKT